MTIRNERPPNFEKILAAFPSASNPGVIFAYGDAIYNPSGNVIPRALLQHEDVHLARQQVIGPEAWWDLYIRNQCFRYHEELYAHVAEYKAQLPGLDRNQHAKLLQSTALRLIAPLYNYTDPARYLRWAQTDLAWELKHK